MPQFGTRVFRKFPKGYNGLKRNNMTKEKYLRLSLHIAMLEDVAAEYPGKTIENIIVQMEARRKEVDNEQS